MTEHPGLTSDLGDTAADLAAARQSL